MSATAIITGSSNHPYSSKAPDSPTPSQKSSRVDARSEGIDCYLQSLEDKNPVEQLTLQLLTGLTLHSKVSKTKEESNWLEDIKWAYKQIKKGNTVLNENNIPAPTDISDLTEHHTKIKTCFKDIGPGSDIADIDHTIRSAIEAKIFKNENGNIVLAENIKEQIETLFKNIEISTQKINEINVDKLNLNNSEHRAQLEAHHSNLVEIMAKVGLFLFVAIFYTHSTGAIIPFLVSRGEDRSSNHLANNNERNRSTQNTVTPEIELSEKIVHLYAKYNEFAKVLKEKDEQWRKREIRRGKMPDRAPLAQKEIEQPTIPSSPSPSLLPPINKEEGPFGSVMAGSILEVIKEALRFITGRSPTSPTQNNSRASSRDYFTHSSGSERIDFSAMSASHATSPIATNQQNLAEHPHNGAGDIASMLRFTESMELTNKLAAVSNKDNTKSHGWTSKRKRFHTYPFDQDSTYSSSTEDLTNQPKALIVDNTNINHQKYIFSRAIKNRKRAALLERNSYINKLKTVLLVKAPKTLLINKLQKQAKVFRAAKYNFLQTQAAQMELIAQRGKKIKRLQTELDKASAQRSHVEEQLERLRETAANAQAASTEQIAQLQTELDKASAQRSHAEEQLEQLQKTATEAKTAAARQTAQLQMELDEASAQRSHAEEQLEQLQKTATEAKTAAAKQTAQLQMELDEASAQRSHAEEQLEQLQKTATEAKTAAAKQTAQLQMELDEASAQRSHAEEQLEQLQKTATEAKTAAAKQTAQLQTELDEASAQLNHKEKELGRLKEIAANAQAAAAQIAQLQMELDKASAQLNHKEKELGRLKETAANAQAAAAQIAQLQMELDKASAQLNHKEKELERLKETAANAQAAAAQIAQLQTELDEASAQHSYVGQRLKQLQKTADEAQAIALEQIAQLKMEKEYASTQLSNTEKELKQLKKTADETQAAATEQIAQLKKDSENAYTQLSNMEYQLKQVKETAANAHAAVVEQTAQLQTELNEASAQRNHAKHQLEQMQKTANEAKIAATGQIAQLETQLNDAITHHNNTKHDLDQVQKTADKAQASLVGQIDQLEIQLNDAITHHNNTKHELEQVQKTADETQTAATEQIAQMKKDSENAYTQLSNTEKELKQLQSEYLELEKTVADEQATATSFKTQCEDASTQINNTKRKLEQLEEASAQHSKTEQQLKQLQIKFEETQNSQAVLIKEISNITQAEHSLQLHLTQTTEQENALKHAQIHLKNLKNAIKKTQNSKIALEEKISKINQDVENMEAKLTQIETEVARITQELEAAKNTQAVVVKAMSDTTQKEKNLQDNLEQINTENTRNKTNLTFIQEQVKQKANALDKAKRTETAVVKAMSKAAQEVKDLQDNLEQINTENANKETDLALAQEQVKQKANALNKAKRAQTAVVKAMSKADKEVKDLQDNLEQIDTENANKETDLALAQEQVKQKANALDKAKRTQIALVEAMSKAAQEVKDLQDNLEKIDTENASKETDLALAQEKVKQKVNALDKAKRTHATLEEVINNTNQDVENLEKQFVKTEAEVVRIDINAQKEALKPAEAKNIQYVQHSVTSGNNSKTGEALSDMTVYSRTSANKIVNGDGNRISKSTFIKYNQKLNENYNTQPTVLRHNKTPSLRETAAINLYWQRDNSVTANAISNKNGGISALEDDGSRITALLSKNIKIEVATDIAKEINKSPEDAQESVVENNNLKNEKSNFNANQDNELMLYSSSQEDIENTTYEEDMMYQNAVKAEANSKYKAVENRFNLLENMIMKKNKRQKDI